MRKEFNIGYEQTISLIKELKNSNDYLNKAIGVESSNSIALRIKREQTGIEQNLSKIQSLIMKLEGSYLDPDTARKIGTVKQQFRIQKDRRKQLLQSVQSTHKDENRGDRGSKQSQITRFTSMSVEISRKSQISEQNQTTREEEQFHKRKPRQHEQQQYDEMGIEFEQKILRQRSQEINHVAKTLLNVQNIVQQTSVLTFQQGQKIDIIGEELFESYKNVREARQNIVEASEHQTRAKRKYIYLSLMIMLIVAIALGIVLI